MPRPVSLYSRTEQPIPWIRAFLAGAGSATLMMGFVDIFNMMGITRFSFERYLGGMFVTDLYATHVWTFGFLLNLALGGLFGFLYAYCFEFALGKAGARRGVWLGFGHAAIAAVALFPFVNTVEAYNGAEVYERFGFFGNAIDAPAPILLLAAHLIFGAMMGTFYGPIGVERVRARLFETGPSARLGHPDLITADEDSDRPYQVYKAG